MTRNSDRLRNQLVAAMRKHLHTGARPAVPEAGQTLWQIFASLSAKRTYHASGPNPIAYAEIEAYARLHRWPLRPHHVEMIRALDQAWLDHAYAQMDSGDGKPPRRASGQAINAAAFDAVFG